MWQKIVRNKHKGEGYKDDELFTEPLLLIEWDNAGIQARTANNANHNKEALVASIRSQPGYTPFPTVNVQPDCAFSFDSRANFSFMIAALRANNWSTRINSVPDVGYAYSVYVPKKGELNIVEEPVIFNVLLWQRIAMCKKIMYCTSVHSYRYISFLQYPIPPCSKKLLQILFDKALNTL
ncbi:hypothetical protein RclHR1_17910001 [Rhizophagus clarus]|uniref:Uncharacterized protein n=1 Tax=Rhizophagus clarus TaxID=94130 RepID=A0A2Z6RDY3_9GLOM|nr:hypothetical protein RclHR1_17910001 [Rhizophagus clarus]